MSLTSHAGKDTFTINGKTINKRTGTSNIYDITALEAGGAGSGLGAPYAWGFYIQGSSGQNPNFTLRHSKNVKYLHNYLGHGTGYQWVLEEALEWPLVMIQYGTFYEYQRWSGMVTSSSSLRVINPQRSQSSSGPHGSLDHSFVVYDTKGADQYQIDAGAGWGGGSYNNLYSDGGW